MSLFIPTLVQPCTHIVTLTEYDPSGLSWSPSVPLPYSSPSVVPGHHLLTDGTCVHQRVGNQGRSDTTSRTAIVPPGSLTFYKDDGGKDTNFIEISVVLRSAPDGKAVLPRDWPKHLYGELAITPELVYCNDVDDAFLCVGDCAEDLADASAATANAVSNVGGVPVCACPTGFASKGGSKTKVSLPKAPVTAISKPEGTPKCPLDKLLTVNGKGEKRLTPGGNGRGNETLSVKTRCRIENISKNHYDKYFRVKAVPSVALGTDPSSVGGGGGADHLAAAAANGLSVKVGPSIVVGCGLSRRVFVKSKTAPAEKAKKLACSASSTPAANGGGGGGGGVGPDAGGSLSPKGGSGSGSGSGSASGGGSSSSGVGNVVFSSLSSTLDAAVTPNHPAYADPPKNKRSHSKTDAAEPDDAVRHREFKRAVRAEAASMLKDMNLEGLVENARAVRQWGDETIEFLNTLSQQKHTKTVRDLSDRFHREVVGKCEEIAKTLEKLVRITGNPDKYKKSKRNKDRDDDNDDNDDDQYMCGDGEDTLGYMPGDGQYHPPMGGTQFIRTESEAYYAQMAQQGGYDNPYLGDPIDPSMPPPPNTSALSSSRSSSISALLAATANNTDLGTFNEGATYGSFDVGAFATLQPGVVVPTATEGLPLVSLMPPPPARASPVLAAVPSTDLSLSLVGIGNGSGSDPLDAPPFTHLKLGHQISSQFIGPSKAGGQQHPLRLQHTVSETLRAFKDTEQAIREIGSGLPSSVGTETNLLPPSAAQYSVHYILAKVWCDSLGQSYGFPAFDKNKAPIGFYRETRQSNSGSGLIVFIPIFDTSFDKWQLAQITQELEVHQAAGSGAVKALDDPGTGGGVGALVEGGKGYYLEKDIQAWYMDDFSQFD